MTIPSLAALLLSTAAPPPPALQVQVIDGRSPSATLEPRIRARGGQDE